MPACYRHPNRETNVSCSNCGRPICPECMTSTPVGMRCPECARERTQVRSGPPAGLGGTSAPATYVLIGISVGAFLLELLGGGAFVSGGGSSVTIDLGLYGPAVAEGEVYRIVTSAFLHAGLLHLAFNMYILYLLGSLLEPGLGTGRLVGLYVVSMLGGSFGALLLEPNAITVGASGAVFGLMAATFLVARRRGLQDLSTQIGILVALNLLITFSVPQISVGGHLGGLVAGGLAALLVLGLERGVRVPRPLLVESVGLVLLGALLVAGSLAVA